MEGEGIDLHKGIDSDHMPKTSLKLPISNVRDCPCRSSSRRFSILFSWLPLRSSYSCRIDDSSRYLLAKPLFCEFRAGAYSRGPSSTLGRS
jgi:hypothetical protein